MYKIYFKQAIALLRQNPFVSIISIAGTALAIMMVMTMIVVRQVRSVALKPESKSNRMLVIDYQLYKRTPNSLQFGNLSNEFLHYLQYMQIPEAVTFICTARVTKPVSLEHSNQTFHAELKATDEHYWNIFEFDWVAGKPYGQEEVEAAMNEVVITASLARDLFGDTDPVGQTVEITFKKYRVTGVVKDISPLFRYAHSDIWIPISTQDKEDYLTTYTVILLAKSPKDFEAITEEVRDIERRFAIENDPQTLWFRGPQTKRDLTLRASGSGQEEFKKDIAKQRLIRFTMIAVLLLIPAVNLAGFSLARMKKRTAEIGIRKAFGARRNVILVQVLFENFISSLIGGILGLLLSYVLIYSFRTWLLGLSAGSYIPFATMFSLPVFGAVFLLCIILNLLSAGIPAYRAAKVSIVNSLNRNEQQRW
ncbi:MAG: ABC transporter permease [Alistipes sp.]|nr:ABC transporter permease [Alistipes sp.]